MPRVKTSGTRWRYPYYLLCANPAVSCDDCGRPDLRVAYWCLSWCFNGRDCWRNRCWKCARARSFPRNKRFPWQPYANIKEQMCKACRAETALLRP